jgi:carboxylesterase
VPDVLPDAEPASFDGGPNGALVIHGFTGSPQGLRGLATAFAGAGFATELPRLPGHGTTVEDLNSTSWADWSKTVEAAYDELAGRCEKVVVAGLSMGGTLTAWLAARHPEIAGAVFVNPVIEPVGEAMTTMLRQSLDAGTEYMPAIGNDVAEPGQVELAYDQMPVAPLLSLFDAQDELAAVLGEIRCPILLFTSTQDHVVMASNSDYLASKVSGPVERVTLERSFHVATLDFDRHDIERRAVEFALKVCA